ncbi:MAG TPA: copper resistance protein CopC [Nitrososphaera sp.]|jgi:copper transport protein|nr:copper resistance protein CopC [Nitrososphaera sp.]
MTSAGGRFRTLTLVLLSVILSISIFGIAQQAFAHPVYVDSQPRAFQSIPGSPSEVNVFFSEPIELDYSRITVLGPDGTRIDMNDKHYVQGDSASIGVTIQPALPEGEYTVTTKVLSAVDGHVTDETFIYGVGFTPIEGSGTRTPILSPDYSASRFPGMVGQVMAVGAAFGALWLWKPIGRVRWLDGELSETKIAIDKTMMKIIIIGAALVLASGIAMIVVQAISIEASIPEAIATKFGNVWITRMLQSSILMGIALAVYRRTAKTKQSPSRAELYALLIIGLAVLVTSSLIAHAAATEQPAAIILDFFHNAAASFWIGGLVLLGFAVVPKILSLRDERTRSAALSLLIPRFSIVIVTLLGISVITGPILLSTLETDLSLTLASVYGQILAIKLALAGVMVAMGAYSQFVVQKKAVSVMAGGGQVVASGLKNYGKVLKTEAGVGIALLLMVSLMANGSLPSGQFPAYQREPGEQQAFAEEIDTSFVRTAYTEEGRIRLSISPFAVGQNNFEVSFLNGDGGNVTSIQSARIKMTQIEKGIGPITIETKNRSPGIFAADAAFSLPGTWALEIEGVNLQGNNMIATMDVNVKPLVKNLEFAVDQYKIPDRSLPLFPLFDAQRQSIWVGDSLPGSGRIWQLDISTGNYTSHGIPDVSLITQTTLDSAGTLWFIDPVVGALGNYDPKTNASRIFAVPDEGVLSGLAMDGEGNLWIPVVQANTIVKFDVEQENFTSYEIPTRGSTPVGVSYDGNGIIWLAEAIGKIAEIDTATGNITEHEPELQSYELDEPTSVFPAPRSSSVFISEHGGRTITAYSPLLGTFREYPVVNEAGLPFGMAMDSYGNLWFAQHEIDRIGVIDPRTGASTEVKIPITGSFIQWLTSDDHGKIWFAAQRGGALGSVTITARPAAPGPTNNGTQGGGSENPIPQVGFSLADVAGPAIVAGIAISALAFAKSATDLRSNIRTALRLKGQ